MSRKKAFDPRDYKLTFQDWFRHNSDITFDGHTVLKDNGNFVQMMFPSSSPKGHDTYDLYLDNSGKLTKVEGHSGNAGFSGTKHL